MTIQDALRHAGNLEDFGQEIEDEVVGMMPGYLWIVDNPTYDTGLIEYDIPARPCRLVHCGRCGRQEVEERRSRGYTVKYPQGAVVKCPWCGQDVTVKHLSRGFKAIEDRLNVLFYRKSAIDPSVVVAIAAHCLRPFRLADERCPWELEPSILPRGIAVFDAANRDSIRIQSRPTYGFDEVGYWRDCYNRQWEVVKSMERLTFGDEGVFTIYKTDKIELTDTLETAVAGTLIGRAWSEEYVVSGKCSVKALDLITRYPCIEYLTKLGMVDFLRRRLEGTLPPGLVNWHGRDMRGVLRLSRERLGQIKGRRVALTVNLCAVLQYVDRAGIRCGIETAEGVAEACRGELGAIKDGIGNALEPFRLDRRAKALKYIARNRARHLRDIVDLWNMVELTGGSLDSDEDAFPRDFRAAHDRMAGRLKDIHNARKDASIRAKLPEMERKYGFEFGGLILRPAASAAEVVREGQTLHHCVGSYVDKYASGQTVICVLRRAVDPDAPFRTVEISPMSGKVVQDRGLHNDWGAYRIDKKYRAMLDLFWAAWGERKIQKARRAS